MKKIIRTLLFIQFLSLLAANLLGPVYSTYVKGIGGDLLTAGEAVAIDTAAIGLFIVISGRIANKYHTEKLQLIIGYVLNIFAVLGFMLVKNPTQLFLVEIIAGTAIAISTPAFSGLYSQKVETGKHTSSWGDYLGLSSFAAAFSALASGFIAQRFGFTTLFITMAILNGLSAIGAVYLYSLPEKNHK